LDFLLSASYFKAAKRFFPASVFLVSLEEGGALTAKIIDLGWLRRSMNQVLKARFQ
jgi:hypothetical protein